MSESVILPFVPSRRPVAPSRCGDASNAQHASESSGDAHALAANLAHDFQGILTPMLMAIAVAQERLTDPESRQLITVLKESVRRGTLLLRQMSMLSPGLERSPIGCDARRLLEDLRRVLALALPRSIDLVVEASSNVPAMVADATEIYEALVNVCVNAWEAMPAGGTLTLRAESASVDRTFDGFAEGVQPGCFVILSVSDTGHGIPDAVRDRVFDAFVSTKPGTQAAGLGLTKAQAIVRARGGFITLETETGCGTTCRLFVPAVEGDVDRNVADETGAAAQPAGECLLIAGDDSALCAGLSRVLRAHGYEVVTAGQGAAAVAEFARHASRLSLVLADISTSALDAAHTVRALRAIDADVPVIAMTGLDDAGDAALQQAEVPVTVIRKPFVVQTLLRAIREALESPRARRTPTNG